MKFKKLLLATLTTSVLSSAHAAQFDYDGDGKADVGVRRASTYFWYIPNTGEDNFNSEQQDGIQRVQFGKQSTDIPIAADFDGDGITDIAVRRPSTYIWYVKNSSGDNTNSEQEDGIQRETFGKDTDDIPVPADYDGDGIADFAVRRASNYTWYIKNSDGSNYNSEQEDGIQRIVFGKNADDIPVPGFYDEDEITDVAVWRESNTTWYILNSSNSNFNSNQEDGIQRISFGEEGDIPVPADYDGDGITDIAVRRPSTYVWYIRYSSDGETYEEQFGKDADDIPIPADYDGDGKADIAVRRASNQHFYILNSSDGEIQRINFGKQENDIPLNAPITEIIAKLNAANASVEEEEEEEEQEEEEEEEQEETNSKPVANAGNDQTVEEGDTVQLSGESSSDADGDTLSYSWSFISMPEDSSSQLSDSNAASPTFVADVSGDYLLSLVVNDGTEDSDADSITITAETVEPANSQPVANAGADQTVNVDELVTLSCANSSDADNDTLTCSWAFTAQPDESSATLDGSTSVTAMFTPDVGGTYEVSLVVHDGTVDSEPDTVSILAEELIVSTTPVADAGEDQTVNAGDTVNLDGSGSNDEDGDELSYQWSITSIPEGSQATLSNSQSQAPSFVADITGDYAISLVVTDSDGNGDTDSVAVTALSVNTKPVAEAGSAQTVSEGDLVQLDGTGSNDEDGDELTYTWSFTGIPSGSQVQLSDSSSSSPNFTADMAGDYVLSLTVNDGTEDSDSDTVTITVEEAAQNNAPVANAGDELSVSVNEEVTLSGDKSTDADSDTLTYSWEMTSKPDDSDASLDGAASITATFTPDIAGDYVISLTVNDGTESDTDDVTVTAANDNIDITDVEFLNTSADCADYAGTYFSNVTDVQEDAQFSGSVTITADEDSCSLLVNEIPNHDFNETGTYRHAASAQDTTFTITRSPEIAAEPTQLTIGLLHAVSLNGVTIATLPAACYGVGDETLGREKSGCGGGQNADNPWRYDPMSDLNSFGTDEHNAHTKSDGAYHYHGNPLAMYDLDCEASGVASPVVAFAADGFPIFGKCFDDNDVIREAQSSYVLKEGQRQDVDGFETPVQGEGDVASSEYDGQFRGDWEYQSDAGDLDECNGMTVNGQYGYYVTDAFPWLVGCISGTVDESFSGRAALDRLLHSHDHLFNDNKNNKQHQHQEAAQ